MVKERYFGEISNDKVKIDEDEKAARLKVSKNYSDEIIEECEKEVRRESKIRYCAARVDVSYGNTNEVDLSFGKIESKSLYKLLYPLNEAIIFCVSLGSENERMQNKLSLLSPSKHFIFDALSSAYVESCCDFVEEELKGNSQITKRFSVGYGDFSLKHQKDILSLLDAGKLLGITQNKNMMMNPCKTVTAVFGVKD